MGCTSSIQPSEPRDQDLDDMALTLDFDAGANDRCSHRFVATPSLGKSHWESLDWLLVTLEGKDENGRWWPAVIKNDNEDGSYEVDLLDGHGTRWPTSPLSNLRQGAPTGARVEGKDATGKWWPVAIKSHNEDGSYQVEVLDGFGTNWTNSPLSNLRKAPGRARL
jgi:hypothetical protein